MAMVLSENVVGKEQHHTIPVMEFEPFDGKCVGNKLNEFQDYLAESSTHYLGCPINLDCHHHVALSQFLKFPLNNIGDPFKESVHGLHSKKFEVGVLDWFAQLWGIEKDEYWGYVTNGGTEGNLHGLLLGRELLPDGILYASRDSHYSIFKAARMYRMNCVKIETLETGEIDCTDLRNKLLHNKDKPAIVNVTIGTTFKGAIDNVDLVIQTLQDSGFSHNQFYIHCDAAISGFIVPFFEQAPMCIFKKPIGSLSISGHKFLGSPMPCGVFITRKKYINIFSENVEYLVSTPDTTITGSRNGHSPIFMWYSLSAKGYAGFQQGVKNCVRNARYLRDRLRNAGISTMLNEMSIIVIFECPLDKEFVRFWQLQCQRNMAHAVIMPHVTTEMLDHFLYDLITKRKSWYSFGKLQHPCLAEDIGIFNCLCSVHGKGN